VAIRQVYFDLNGTLFDPSVMAEPIGGAGADDLVEEILGEAVLLAMAETLSGSYRDFAELLRAATFRRLALAGSRGFEGRAVVRCRSSMSRTVPAETRREHRMNKRCATHHAHGLVLLLFV
jgi:hypothetical protein